MGAQRRRRIFRLARYTHSYRSSANPLLPRRVCPHVGQKFNSRLRAGGLLGGFSAGAFLARCRYETHGLPGNWWLITFGCRMSGFLAVAAQRCIPHLLPRVGTAWRVVSHVPAVVATIELWWRSVEIAWRCHASRWERTRHFPRNKARYMHRWVRRCSWSCLHRVGGVLNRLSIIHGILPLWCPFDRIHWVSWASGHALRVGMSHLSARSAPEICSLSRR